MLVWSISVSRAQCFVRPTSGPGRRGAAFPSNPHIPLTMQRRQFVLQAGRAAALAAAPAFVLP
ncbi:hypothetical protein E4O93_10475, partial [Diaphorobacter sp. DS2]